MSMNLTLNIVKQPCGCSQSIDLLQTPTDITFQAIGSPNPAEVYFNWLDSQCWDSEIIEKEKERIKNLIDDPNLVLEWGYI